MPSKKYRSGGNPPLQLRTINQHPPLTKINMVMNAPNNGILSTIGFILSAYSVYVEHKIHQHETLDDDEGGFKALCDIDTIGATTRTVFSRTITNVAITYIKSLAK
eukprot:scaffold11115_cov67-Cyclotella_meneghiniana.AAC.5